MKQIALAIVFIVGSACAENWPAWRGADGNGICRETQLPLRWSTNENIRWHVPLPDRGNSTPIVWSNRVFVTQAIEKENRRSLMCFENLSQTDGPFLVPHPLLADKKSF